MDALRGRRAWTSFSHSTSASEVAALLQVLTESQVPLFAVRGCGVSEDKPVLPLDIVLAYCFDGAGGALGSGPFAVEWETAVKADATLKKFAVYLCGQPRTLRSGYCVQVCWRENAFDLQHVKALLNGHRQSSEPTATGLQLLAQAGAGQSEAERSHTPREESEPAFYPPDVVGASGDALPEEVQELSKVLQRRYNLHADLTGWQILNKARPARGGILRIDRIYLSPVKQRCRSIPDVYRILTGHDPYGQAPDASLEEQDSEDVQILGEIWYPSNKSLKASFIGQPIGYGSKCFVIQSGDEAELLTGTEFEKRAGRTGHRKWRSTLMFKSAKDGSVCRYAEVFPEIKGRKRKIRMPSDAVFDATTAAACNADDTDVNHANEASEAQMHSDVTIV